MQAIQLLFILVAAVVAGSAQKSYDGFKLYKVVPKTQKQVQILEQIRDSGLGDFWMDYFKVDDDLRVLVSPEMQEVFQGRLMQAGLEVKTIIEDVQQVINQQLNPNQVVSSRSSGFLSYDWDSYHNLTVIEEWLDEVAAAYPSVVSLVTMGYSVENRPIRGIIINYNPSIIKPVGIIEGTLHAREWISPATVTWIIKEFLNSTDADVRAMAEDTEWHIFPVVNPDGYEYTFNGNRMWRKNRSTANFTSCNSTGVDDDMSNGVDLNRNFDFYWMSVGASDNPCTNTFAGPSAGSEPETKAISQYVLNLHQGGRNIMYYLSFHSFSQLFILPYSHVTEPAADNHDDLMVIASNSSTKIFERYQTTYKVGIAQEVLYPMSGSSFDWVKLYANASVSYLIELRDLGETGFLLPPEQIIPNNLEMMDGLIEMDKATKRLGYFSGASSVIYSLTLVSLAVVFVNLIN